MKSITDVLETETAASAFVGAFDGDVALTEDQWMALLAERERLGRPLTIDESTQVMSRTQ